MDHAHYMMKALELAEKALAAGEFPAACILVGSDGIIAAGSRIGTVANRLNEIDHAEILALRNLNHRQVPFAKRQLTAYCTLEPCLMCFGALLIHGVKKIVYAYEDAMGGGTRCNLTRLPPLYRNLTPTVIPHILRSGSLRLFKSYFLDPQSAYLKNSFLATYTLRQ